MRKPLIGEVDPHVLLERLAFAQEETEDAALEQAKLYMGAVTYRIQKMRSRQEAEMHVDNLRVDLSLKMRFKYKSAGKKGVTERAIQEMVERYPDLRAAVAVLAKTKRLEEWSKGLLEAYEHRRSAIRVLAQYAFMRDDFDGKFEVDKMKDKRDRLRRQFGKEQDE